MKKPIIVLAMHGAPPQDFPKSELREFMGLHGRIGHGHHAHEESLRLRYLELEKKMRAWPRHPENDPFYAGSRDLAEALEKETGLKVILGFNEFCAPAIDEAIDQAAAAGAEVIIVVTPMMTRGGGHSEVDIPQAIARAKAQHPDKKIVYAWPFAPDDVARFLSTNIKKWLSQ